MGILRRKKLKRHINKISYMAVFTMAAVVITVTAMSGNDKVEYLDLPETETYVVDVVSREREKVAIAGQQIETTVAEEITTADDKSSYKGIFMMNTSGNLNVRSKADTSSEIVGILTEGNGGNVVKYGDEWTKIKSGNVTGYVATEYIVIGKRAQNILEKNGYIATVNTDTLMVRSRRSTNSSVVGMAANGTEYKCNQIYPKWVKIKFEGQSGYVSREFVKLETVMTYGKTVAEIEAEQATEAPETEAMTEAQQPGAVQNTTAPEQPVTEPQTSKNTQTTTNASYDEKYLLACLVACEAGGESYEAKLAVANVVLNRVASSSFPNSISGVIYQSGQFGPVSNSSLDRMLKNGPDSGSQQAANAALAGNNNVPGYLFFGQTSALNVNNLGSYRIIDNQVFY